jgi:RNA polymerase sigma-70 factor (ECF subfamily)
VRGFPIPLWKRFGCRNEAPGVSGGWFRKNESKFVRIGFVNGLPGFIALGADGELQTTAIEIEEGKIAAIYVMRNPEKLRHLQ